MGKFLQRNSSRHSQTEKQKLAGRFDSVYVFLLRDCGTGFAYTRHVSSGIFFIAAARARRQTCGDSIIAMGAGANAEIITRLPIIHRSEEHTSELQSLAYLVCRLLLEKKKKKKKTHTTRINNT